LPEIRDVVNTNFCDIGVRVTGMTAVVVSCIDNLLKGAAGQAVQNMNIICGFDEKEGLDW
jgi:N-acetyl-gamma-glutamyl-phosphate reductase